MFKVLGIQTFWYPDTLGSRHFGLILILPLVVCLRLRPSALAFGLRPLAFGLRPSASGLRPPAFGLRPQRLRRCAPAALHEFNPGTCTCLPVHEVSLYVPCINNVLGLFWNTYCSKVLRWCSEVLRWNCIKINVVFFSEIHVTKENKG